MTENNELLPTGNINELREGYALFNPETGKYLGMDDDGDNFWTDCIGAIDTYNLATSIDAVIVDMEDTLGMMGELDPDEARDFKIEDLKVVKIRITGKVEILEVVNMETVECPKLEPWVDPRACVSKVVGWAFYHPEKAQYWGVVEPNYGYGLTWDWTDNPFIVDVLDRQPEHTIPIQLHGTEDGKAGRWVKVSRETVLRPVAEGNQCNDEE